jgi:S1-C subfamily serine protease
MDSAFKSHLVSAVLGGLVVVGGVVVLGITGRQHTVTIIEQAPVAAQAASDPSSGLTPHDIYQRYKPGVVFVRAKLVEQVTTPFDLFRGRASHTSTGSGFLVDNHGDILTNYHVINGAARSGGVTVQFENAATRSATVVAVDPKDDLAVLRVDMRQLPPIRPLALGDSTSVRVGDPTLAIGNPFGVDRTLTSGIVSALQHQIQASDGRSINNVIQTDQPIAAGNSGGPLLDADGRVIGINSQIATAAGSDGLTQRLAFAIPIDTADAVLATVDQQAPVRVAYLGLRVGGAVPARTGAVIASIDREGPASSAGLRDGDTIERVDNRPVASISDVLAVVSTYSPGQTVAVVLRRGRHRRIVSVVLGSRTVSPGS